MFCKYCGKEISENSKFCRYCGKEILNETKSKIVPEDKLKSLSKIYKAAGNSSIALSIFGLVLSTFINLTEYNVDETILGVIIFLPFVAPFYYFGKKLKDHGIENIDYAYKVSRGMLIYIIVFIIANLLLGGIGWLWFILLYYFYKAYKETKDVLQK